MSDASKPHSARPPLEAPEGVAAYAAEGGLVRASFFRLGEKSRGGRAATFSFVNVWREYLLDFDRR